MPKIDRVEVEYDFPLSDIQVSNLVTATSNGEGKCLSLGLLHDRYIYNRKGLYQYFLQSQGEKPGWKPAEGIPFSYCDTLPYKRGLVQRVYLDTLETIYGLQITEHGSDIGIPLAFSLLDLSRRYEPSLVELCGGSTTFTPELIRRDQNGPNLPSGRTGAAVRIAIFRELKGVTSVGLNELARRCNQDIATVSESVRGLVKTGIISRPSADNINKLPIRISLDEVDNLIVNSTRLQDEDDDLSYVISLSTEQRALVTEFTEIVDAIQRGDANIIRQGLELMNYYLSNKSEVASLMAKAKKHSRYANQTPVEKTKQRLLGIIKIQHHLNSVELATCLEEDFGQTMTRSAILHILNEMENEGLAIFSRNGTREEWFAPAETPEDSII